MSKYCTVVAARSAPKSIGQPAAHTILVGGVGYSKAEFDDMSAVAIAAGVKVGALPLAIRTLYTPDRILVDYGGLSEKQAVALISGIRAFAARQRKPAPRPVSKAAPLTNPPTSAPSGALRAGVHLLKERAALGVSKHRGRS